MIDNIEKVRTFILRYKLELSPIILEFKIRRQDRGFEMILQRNILQNISFLDDDYIRMFCNKHKCRCYIYIMDNKLSFDVYNFNSTLFKIIYCKYVGKELNLELYRGRVGINSLDFHMIDVDDKSNLDCVINFLKINECKDITIFNSKTGYSVIFRSCFNFILKYIDDPVSYNNGLYCGPIINLYIPDFS